MISAADVMTRAVRASPRTTPWRVSPVLVVLLAHAREQEHLVVHRQPEQHREHHHRHERHDRHGALEADEALRPSPLEDRDGGAVRRGDREQVHHRGGERHEDRVEHQHQQEERQQHDRADEVGEPVADAVADVDERGGDPPTYACAPLGADRLSGAPRSRNVATRSAVCRAVGRGRRDHADLARPSGSG